MFVLLLMLLAGIDAAVHGGSLWMPGSEDGVVKQTEPDPVTVAKAQGMTATNGTERQLLPSVLQPGTTVTAKVLLKNNDRAATIAWVDSPDVKTIFTNLRKSLRISFSPDLKDVIDETQSEPGKPPRDVLSFLDPAIAPDRLLFVRIRQRLYEFHVTAGSEKDVNELIDALTD
jgi:hypothetical protein